MMKCLVTAIASMMVPPLKTTLKKQVVCERIALEKSLRLYRTEQAFARSVPATSIYDNKLISEISTRKPTTLKQLLAVRGMGARRCKSYGSDILKLVTMSNRHKGRGRAIKKLPLTSPRPRPRPKPRPKPRPRPACAAEAKQMDPNTSPHHGPHTGKKDSSKGRGENIEKTRALITAPKLSPKHALKPSKSSVYIIELQDGRVYVGSSRDVERRIAQHAAGYGSAYTRVYKPTGVRLPRLGNVSGDGDAAERDETLRYMFQRGIPFVRGWKFTQVALPPDEFDEAEANIRELYDLCRRCGYKGHFISHCKATFDRWGKQCGGNV